MQYVRIYSGGVRIYSGGILDACVFIKIEMKVKMKIQTMLWLRV